MSETTSSSERRRAAAEALQALTKGSTEHERLSVQCPRSHHLAAVHDTAAGLVYRTRTGPHSHGSKDFVDTSHHAGEHGTEYVDLLPSTAADDDALPAWCDCGPWTLSRADLLAQIRAGLRTYHVT